MRIKHFIIPESFLVDGLNQLAMNQKRCAAASAFEGSICHPDDDPIANTGDAQRQQLQQQQQQLVVSSSALSLSGVDGGLGAGGGGGGVFVNSSTSFDILSKSQMEQPTYFSTPYSK